MTMMREAARNDDRARIMRCRTETPWIRASAFGCPRRAENPAASTTIRNPRICVRLRGLVPRFIGIIPG